MVRADRDSIHVGKLLGRNVEEGLEVAKPGGEAFVPGEVPLLV